MVIFVCESCQATLKKNQVNRHCEFDCPKAWIFSCIDCGKAFQGFEFEKHISCKTENEIYKIPQKPVQNGKNQLNQKQEEWKGWKHTLKRVLKNIKFGMKISKLQNKIIPMFLEQNKGVKQEEAIEIFNQRIQHRRFVIKDDKVIYYKNVKNQLINQYD